MPLRLVRCPWVKLALMFQPDSAAYNAMFDVLEDGL